MVALDLVVAVGCLLASGLAGRRWLLAAQREGWAPGAASRWALRWWTLEANAALAVVAVASLAAAPVFRPAALSTAVAVAVGPLGLPLRGRRPSRLAWTGRALRVAAVAVLSAGSVAGAGLLVGTGTSAVLAGVVALLAPVLVDVGALATGGADLAEPPTPTSGGADGALARLAARTGPGKRVLVAAGPYGPAGEDLAERAVAVATHLLLVGRHARRALQRGAARGPAGCTIVVCHDAEHAEAWVAAETGPADFVEWLATPPDHVP